MNKSPYAHAIAQELNLPPEQVAATIALLEAGNTLPFIARYRKEITGGLDEEQIRQISSAVERLRRLDKRRRTILSTIEAQGKLTPALRQRLLAAETMTALEDLYRPYKPKRRTRATVAKEKGLQGLADLILEQALTGQTVAELVAPFLSDDVPTVEEALAGARDIVAETIADHADVRQQLREKALRWGMIRSERVHTGEENEENENNDPTGVYATYYDFEMPINRLRPHQVLAMNRGEAEKVLRLRVEITDRDWLTVTEEHFPPDYRSPLAKQLTMATEDAARRLLLPAIERSVRRHLTAQAETHAIAVFAANLRALLNQPPLVGHTVLGIDPGYRTGCKVAVADPTGKVLATTTIYPHEPQRRWRQALETLVTLIARYRVTLIAIGNGTASRETERLAAEVIHTLAEEPATETPPRYLIVSEAGASVYSASPLARAELPDLDVSMRGAVSIARRVQDPLAELVKIAPQSIGVGMYQHDVNRQALEATLHSVVESVVNQVGVDVNTASPALLTYVAGIGPRLAERIVAYRDENGPFRNRAALLRVPGIGAKTFEQAAGFLRVRGGDNPLDESAIHPESYPVAEAVLAQAGLSPQTAPAEREPALRRLLESHSMESLAAELGTGVPTLKDIFEQLIRPGRDPRADLPPPILRSDVLTMDDLKPGMRLKGTVRNVVDFGAFVDIGVKRDGLLHRSQIPVGERLQVGDVLKVHILDVDTERNRISLGWAEHSLE